MLRVFSLNCGRLGGVVAGICVCVVGMGAARGDEGDAGREPFEAPRTEAELRWLMDQSDAQQFQMFEEAEGPPRGRGQPGFVWPQGVAPELERIQRELGGSAVEQFPSLRNGEPRGAKPPATADPRQAADAREGGVQEAPPWGGAPAAEQDRRKVEALREAASQLDVMANRLEHWSCTTRPMHCGSRRSDCGWMRGAWSKAPKRRGRWVSCVMAKTGARDRCNCGSVARNVASRRRRGWRRRWRSRTWRPFRRGRVSSERVFLTTRQGGRLAVAGEWRDIWGHARPYR